MMLLGEPTSTTICSHAAPGTFAMLRGLCVALVGLGLCAAVPESNGEEAVQAGLPAEQVEFFETKIRPLFAEECYRCHSDEAKKLKGDLRLDTRSGMLKGGETGAAIVPGNPDASLLIKAVRYKDQDTAMPPKRRLSDAQIADLEAWVKLGSPYPEKMATAAPSRDEKKRYDWEKFRLEHWAFRKVVKTQPPPVKNAAWPRNAVDHVFRKRRCRNTFPTCPRRV